MIIQIGKNHWDLEVSRKSWKKSLYCFLYFFQNRGNVSGDEPPSMVCKISGNAKRKFNFITRLFLFATKNPLVGAFNRHETAFYQQVAPHLTDTFFKFPKVFFAGM